MAVFQVNRRKCHKFFISLLLFGFSMARIVTLALRMAWAREQHNVQVGVASQVFTNAGVLIVYVVNAILAQRILRAKHPHLGWHAILRVAFRVFYILISIALVGIITSVVLSVYTLNAQVLQNCRNIQLVALTYIFIFTLLPLPIVGIATFLPTSAHEETFGEGSTISKSVIITLSSCICLLIAGFKAGVGWSTPRSLEDPGWYDSKATFYVFNFTLEILALGFLTITRIDKRFHVPDGCKQAGDYTRLRDRMSLEGSERTDDLARLKGSTSSEKVEDDNLASENEAYDHVLMENEIHVQARLDDEACDQTKSEKDWTDQMSVAGSDVWFDCRSVYAPTEFSSAI